MLLCESALVISVRVKKESRYDDENKFSINMLSQILNTITSQYKGIPSLY
jgi:hypothetical protein